MKFYIPTGQRDPERNIIALAPSLDGVENRRVLLLSNGKERGHKLLRYFGSLLREHEASVETDFWDKVTITMPADSQGIERYAMEVDAVITAIGD